jgi:superfamily II DNA/RNA helicase
MPPENAASRDSRTPRPTASTGSVAGAPRRRRRSGRPAGLAESAPVPAAAVPVQSVAARTAVPTSAPTTTLAGTAAPAARTAAPAATSARTAAPGSTAGFTDLGVPAVLARALAAQGIDAPFPIQTATLPDSLAGKDVLGRGRTGSGKTLAFSLPLVTRLVGGSRRPKQPRALVLVPTRELANQVHAVVDPLVRAVGLTSTVVFGGVGQNPQVKALSAGVDVLIACPGRLEDLIGQGFCDLSGVEITILDEADHMADLGFLPAVKRLLDRTRRAASGCCSPRRSTTAWTCWSSATCPRRSPTRSTRPSRRCRR